MAARKSFGVNAINFSFAVTGLEAPAIITATYPARRSGPGMFPEPMIDHQYNCRVCGLRLEEPPWGRDGATPLFEIRPCCGVRFDEDSTPRPRLKI